MDFSFFLPVSELPVRKFRSRGRFFTVRLAARRAAFAVRGRGYQRAEPESESALWVFGAGAHYTLSVHLSHVRVAQQA